MQNIKSKKICPYCGQVILEKDSESIQNLDELKLQDKRPPDQVKSTAPINILNMIKSAKIKKD